MDTSKRGITGPVLLVFLMGLLSVAVLPSESLAVSESYCRRYADEAVRANNEAQRLKCRYGGARWSSDWQGHFNWCRGARKGDAIWETLERRKAIQGCRSAVNNCRTYAQRAVAQQQENINRSCGYTGARWHSNYSTHYNWCFANAGRIKRVKQEDMQRKLALMECRQRGTKWDSCAEYARKAVAQQQENKRLGCGYWGFAWHEDYKGHYNWCQRARNWEEVRRETNNRAAELSKCRRRRP